MTRGAADDCLVAHLEITPQRRAVPTRGLRMRRAHNATLLLTGDILVFALCMQILALPVSVAAACVAGFAFRGLYPGWGLDRSAELGLQVTTILTVFGLWILFAAPPVTITLLSLPGALILVPLIRRSVKHVLLAANVFGMPVAIYGAGTDGRNLLEVLRANADMGFTPIAFLDDHPAYWGAHVHGLPVLGDTNVVLTQAWVGILAMPDVEPGFREFLMDGPLSSYPHSYDIQDGENPLRSLKAC